MRARFARACAIISKFIQIFHSTLCLALPGKRIPAPLSGRAVIILVNITARDTIWFFEMLKCLYPRPVAIYPIGSKIKKDGTAGKLVSFSLARIRAAQDAQIRAGEIPTGFLVPCGKCINCRRNKGFQWSRRLLMESVFYPDEEMCFLTLTYEENSLPADGLLHPEHPSEFIKVLRESVRRRVPGCTLRYFLCGEYGDSFERPHYHMILFGYDFFQCSRIASYAEDGTPLYKHPLIDNAWKKGYAVFGCVTPASIQYVAGYVTKKFRKDCQKEVPPFIRMSTKPGIGNRYLLAQSDNILRDGGFYLKGKFYKLDSDSFRFMIRSGVLSEDDKIVSFFKNRYVSELRDKLNTSSLDPGRVNSFLALKYCLFNRLYDAVPH